MWAAVVKALPEEQMKFALNAALDVLPHNSQLKPPSMEEKEQTLCGGNQTLLHVLNNCTTARDLQRYNSRHDLVLQDIASAIKPHLPATTTLSVGIGEGYQFPCCIVSTDLRPDIVWWDFSDKSVCFTELTVCFETNFVNTAARKTTDLVWQARSNATGRLSSHYKLAQEEVPHYESFAVLARVLNMSNKVLVSLITSTAKAAIQGSFKIWCSRNRTS